MNIALSVRRLLIKIGKILPFAICFLVLISYVECIIGLLHEDFIYASEYVIINKPISHWIGQYFEYDLLSIVVMLIVSIAIETCIYNKLAIGYLALQLWFKNIIINYELEPNTIIAISIINIIITTYLIYKGTKQL